ncbi:monofunctional biosynthetic peptidoglycan transglycosylase [Candidatus Halocynthiibacter alkanivorans]|uniref:monofunctional biosynthetic peptidoglycan transglycosylase n=1 Tax=Candidatus Halocynthiibacter alkanivorans TaxID=2267619 RepID=UPI000DF13C7A|nr:monofunctional biosynthetic peptidoglycan transglycosylase [Candidatus Halocynthiibacter alkanivorans]
MSKAKKPRSTKAKTTAKTATGKARKRKTGAAAPGLTARLRHAPLLLRRWALLIGGGFAALLLLVILLYAVVNPPLTPYIFSESRRLGGVEREWAPLEEIAPEMLLSVVAAEDANFCEHWGFDMGAIRAAIDAGSNRGASTISQQVVKNLFLWQGRSWPRKALESLLTPVVELVWSKRRILELYLNVAEFDEGVFGVDAAAWRYFRVGPQDLSADQAARLAAVLPNPKGWSASATSAGMARRAVLIADGAATIRADGRAACLED